MSCFFTRSGRSDIGMPLDTNFSESGAGLPDDSLSRFVVRFPSLIGRRGALVGGLGTPAPGYGITSGIGIA